MIYSCFIYMSGVQQKHEKWDTFSAGHNSFHWNDKSTLIFSQWVLKRLNFSMKLFFSQFLQSFFLIRNLFLQQKIHAYKKWRKKNKKKKNSRKINVICVPKVMPSISVKKMLLFVICLFKIIFWKFILNSNLNGDSCWIKVQKICISLFSVMAIWIY